MMIVIKSVQVFEGRRGPRRTDMVCEEQGNVSHRQEIIGNKLR